MEYSTAQANARRIRVDTKMVTAPMMEFADKAAWDMAVQANQNGSGQRILDYAERWARMMQLELAQGKALADVWEPTSFEADLEGMSGFSSGLATHLLTQCWVHGAELRRLHNASYGSDSQGTVNPAVLVVNSTPAIEVHLPTSTE